MRVQSHRIKEFCERANQHEWLKEELFVQFDKRGNILDQKTI